MMFLVVLAILSVASEGCELPEQLVGHWESSLAGWQDLTISNTTIFSLSTDTEPYPFSCFNNTNTTFLLRSPELSVGILVIYHYYICLDIVPSGTNPDLVFFRIRTEDNPDHKGKPFQTIPIDKEPTLEGVCNKTPTELPQDYNVFLRKDYEENLGNETCPSSLQAVFSANFTEYSKCPGGFVLNGCDRSHLTFNYTQCDGGADGLGSSGSPNYTCLTSLEDDDFVYTIITLQEEVNRQQPNPYHFACLAQKKQDGDQLKITKSAGVCGGTPSVDMTAEETLSCRSKGPETTEAPTTPAGSGNTTQASTPSPEGPGTGDEEQGGGGAGDGNSCTAASWGILSLLLPAFVSTLVVGKM